MTETISATAAGAQEWWAARLRDRRAELGPPLPRRRSSVYRRRSAHVVRELPADVAAGGDALLVAAVTGVLYRYLGEALPAGVVVGVPDAAGVPVPVLVEVDPDTTGGALRAAAQTALAEAADQGGCDVPALLATLGLDEVRNRNPLHPVVIGAVPAQDVRNDVTVTATADGLDLEYNANVLDEGTATRFAGHVAAFAAQLLAAPDTAVRAVDHLQPDERALIVEQWSRGAAQPVPERCLHELVEEAAAARPDQEALVLEDEVLTFSELDRTANGLAHHLRTLGVRRGTPVGLCVSASPRMLVSALAILKSGAACVPIVPTFPVSRNQRTVEDSGMPVVVTEEALRDRFTGPDAPQVVCLDRDGAAIAKAPTSSPEAGTTPDDPVYILFTSGSTGRPKGVTLRHRTLVNLVNWQRTRGLDPAGQRTLQRTSIGFDVSFQEIFSTWGYGGCLVVATDEVRDDVSQLPEVIERYGITRLFLPPVALDQMAVTANLTGRRLPTLREVIVAGEQLRISMPIRRLYHELDCTLDNQYGPTETHVVTAHRMEGASTRWPEAPPIGRPIANARVYLLDPWDQPVPAGVPGEIVIGGISPGIGYLDPEQTAERFAPDPLDPSSGPVYRTGDRGRFLADGTVEFLGRADDQIKIRGYRIELGDVEAHMLRIPGIRAAAAAVHETEALGKQLAGYVVTDEPGVPDVATIRETMLADLPGHMVPSGTSLLYVDELPLTATGKIDRRALPAPPRTAGGAGGAVEGATEETVASVWARALQLENVGRDDSFIDLGGHSLIGIQVVAQLNELYSVAVPLRTLLRGTTVGALAAEIDRLRGVTPADAAAPQERAAAVDLQEIELGGRTVVTPQPAETRYLHLDVTERGTYDRGGITYPETGVVVDAGAHIGLFALHVAARAPGADVLAFEPCPPLHEALERNTAALPRVRRFPVALGASDDTAELTYYPQLTGMTSFRPDAAQERALLGGILENLEKLGDNATSSRLAGSEEYLAERLQAVTYTVRRRRLSDVLAEAGVDRVDLLKIDVQKSELDVLAGVSDADWPRIRQVVVELHDLDGELAQISELLRGKGFAVTAEQDALHEGTAVHFVYAVRS